MTLLASLLARSAVASAEPASDPGPAPIVAAIHWAFVPPTRPDPPAPRSESERDWCRTQVDRFLIRQLADSGLSPAPEADRRTLIRRLSFDLRGIPPTPAEIAGFVDDPHPDAFERRVEQYLASPEYGERWGRHWLDIAGYADSNGYFNADSDRPLAWRYRDYVIASINADKPFDRFVQEQLAGDELAGYVSGGDVTPDRIEPLVAVHFLRNPPDGTGESDGNPLELKVDRYSVLEGGVQLIGHAFLGLTLQCARCHDHKFEPITQAEYYGLQAILRPAFDPARWLKPGERVIEVGTRAEREERARRTRAADAEMTALRDSLKSLDARFRTLWVEEQLAALDESVRGAIRAALDRPEAERDATMQALLETHRAVVAPGPDELGRRFPELAEAQRALEAGVTRVAALRPAPAERIATLFEPDAPPPDHALLIRGSHAHEGGVVPPAVPAALDPASRAGRPTGIPSRSGHPPGTSSGRRLALARWLTAPDHPLLARVTVNRVWAHHFGRGIVPTVDNLGRSGARPTHPELLDWLATEFIRSGWSLKHLHRLILGSAAWRQSGAPDPDQAARYAGHPLRRLDAEALRDSLLAASGELDASPGGPYVAVRLEPDGPIGVDESAAGGRRRSLYLRQRRTEPVGWLQLFDGPEPNPVCIQRQNATVPLQSLAMLNSGFIRQRSRALAGLVRGRPGGMAAAFERAWGRPASGAEAAAAAAFLDAQRAVYAGRPDPDGDAWTDLCQMILAANPTLYVD